MENRENALSGLRSSIDGFGSAFVPNEAMISLYESYLNNTGK